MPHGENGFDQPTVCEFNLSNPKAVDFMRTLNVKLYPLYYLYFGAIPLPLTLITTGCTIAYALSICRAMRTRRVSTKCYMLILNRALGDLLSCACFFCCTGYLFIIGVDRFRVDVLLVIAALCGGCYWTAMFSYVLLSTLKLFAVHRPIQYKKLFSLSHCLYLVAVSWLIYVLIVFATLTAFVLVADPKLQKWSGCRRSTCMHMVARVKNIAFAIAYFFTLTVFGVTVVLIRTHHRSSMHLHGSMYKKPARRPRIRFPFWKLTLNVSTFAVFNFFYMVVGILLMPRGQCSEVVSHPEMVGAHGAIWSSLLVRILIDSVLGLCTDRQLQRKSTINGSTASNQPVSCATTRRIGDRRTTIPETSASATQLPPQSSIT